MSKLLKLFAIFIIGFGLTSISTITEAYYTQYNCHWTRAHWAYGRWYPAQKVCYGNRYYRNNHCRVVPAHWRYGQHYPAQRVCW